MQPKFLIVEARFYTDIAEHLVSGAKQAFADLGAECDTVEVPGALEIPAAIHFAALEAPRYYQGFVALGCVIRGETTHYDYVCTESAHGLQQLALNQNLAIGNGILTVENRGQAIARADPAQKNKGKDAAVAAYRLYDLKHHFHRLGTGA